VLVGRVTCIVNVAMMRSGMIPVDSSRGHFLKYVMFFCWIGCVGVVSGFCHHRCYCCIQVRYR